MTTLHDSVTVAQLRAEFDSIFERPAVLESEVQQVLLAITTGGDPYALPLAQLKGLEALRNVVAIPSGNPHFLGLIGLRGHIVPTFRLPALLGYPNVDDRLRWLALCGTDSPIGLAFESLEGTLRVPSAALSAPPRSTQQHDRQVSAVLQCGDGTRTILNIGSIVGSIAQAATHGGAPT